MTPAKHGPLGLLALVTVTALLGVWLSQPGPWEGQAPLVVYCAHDAIYSTEILQDFERHTGIPLQVRYDTEATKSLGLVELIRQERARPQCDVFWNNELLGTLDLQADGLLEPYRGAGWERIPEQFRDPEGHWVGLAARMRIWIVNPQQMTPTEDAITQLLAESPAQVAMARPMFGTTLTHYCVLAETWGLDRLQDWHRNLRLRGLREVSGNGTSKDVVVTGTCACGWTDTDDYFLARDAGAAVEHLPVLIDGRAIVIPNSVAIIRGTRHRQAAERLVDFLAAAETELRLARSNARQIPLGPVDDASLPEEVRSQQAQVATAYDLRGLLPIRRQVLDWLRTEYAP